jgi:hypothetical protein
MESNTTFKKVVGEGKGGWIPYSTLSCNGQTREGAQLWVPISQYGRDYWDLTQALDYGGVLLSEEDTMAALAVGEGSPVTGGNLY